MMESAWLSDKLVHNYAKIVDDKPIHLFYERPNLWSLLPANLHAYEVLDLGCGSGWYAEQLIKAGAIVTAVDINPHFIQMTRQRLKDQGNFFVADLNQPLDFLRDHQFDIILAPLVLHYIEDLNTFMAQISKFLRKNGIFVFSTHHPHTRLFKIEPYFKKVCITDEWPNIGTVSFFHHSLHDLFAAINGNSLSVSRLLEPQPLPELEKTDSGLWQKLKAEPWFLFVQATRYN